MKFYIKILVCLLLPLAVIVTKPIIAESIEIESPADMTTIGQINYYSELYGVDSGIINKVIQCESNGNINAVGDSGRSYGIAQFQKPTFSALSIKLGEKLDYYSTHDQIKLLAWSIANGYGNRWTAYKAIMNGGKYSFYSSQLHRYFNINCKL
jgi:hypothetical protein